MKALFPIAIAMLFLFTGCVDSSQNWSEARITIDGLERLFRIYTPAGLADGAPLVILLHGGTGDMYSVVDNRHAGSREWTAIADEERLLLLVPNGINRDTGEGSGTNQEWNDCRGDSTSSSMADDVEFVRALIDWAVLNHAIDENRVYATGASNGGMMSFRLAIELSDRIAAIAAFIANVAAVSDCSAPSTPVPVFICNGTEDPLVPWEGGGVIYGRSGTVISAPATRDFWIEANGCDPVPVESFDLPDLYPEDDATVHGDRYASGSGVEVLFYTVQGGGHNIPSLRRSNFPLGIFGSQNRDIEGARHAWEFLKRFSKPPA
ncbi:MAG: prolyl oligopeptidase family serine peptidase [Candidatus Hydrogenedentes bacterium]|nr:prolyl oligopeptidase family serine peptidase [Candidatus Hydrogenedentota bacterium]